jgi:hypothetical protein
VHCARLTRDNTHLEVVNRTSLFTAFQVQNSSSRRPDPCLLHLAHESTLQPTTIVYVRSNVSEIQFENSTSNGIAHLGMFLAAA